MDVLKGIASLPLKALLGNPLICVFVFVGATVLLWLPDSWLRPTGLDLLREEIRVWIGLVWLVYLGAVIYHLVERLPQWWKSLSSARSRKRKMQARLERLTAGQKFILSRFVEEDRSYLDLPASSDDVRELVRSGILVSPYIYNVDPDFDSYGTYEIDGRALRFVKENPGAIWLSLDEMRSVDFKLLSKHRSAF